MLDCSEELGVPKNRPRLSRWRAAVGSSEGGSVPARAGIGTEPRPRAASAPELCPAHASSKHPPSRPLRVQDGRLRLENQVKCTRNSLLPRGDGLRPGSPTQREPKRFRARKAHARPGEGACGVTRLAVRLVTPSRPLLKVGARGCLPCCPAPTPPLTFPPPPSTLRSTGPPTRPFPYQHPRPRQRRRRRTTPRRRHFVSEPVERLNRARSCFFGGSGSDDSQCGCAELAGDAGWPERWSGGGAGAAGGVARR